MGPHVNRRAVLVGLAVPLAGCTGPQIGYDEDATKPVDQDGTDEELDAQAVVSILEFAEDSNETLEWAVTEFSAWLDDDTAVETAVFDDLRREATTRFDTYIRDVSPYLEQLNELEPGDTVSEKEWMGDGAKLATALARHEQFLVLIEETAITLIDAEANRDLVGSPTISDAETIVEEAPTLVERTVVAMPHDF